MKVITIRQPWASLIICGAKGIETRSWATRYRGPVLIHSSAAIGKKERELWGTEPFRFYMKDWVGMPMGAIIGQAVIREVYPTEHLIGCMQFNPSAYNLHEKDFGDYSAGRFGWVLTEVKPFKSPILVKGQLGLWNYESPIPM